MPSLSELRKNRTNISDLQNKISNKRQADERFWSAQRDKQGNANTIIRFLPQADLDANPFAVYYEHFFQNAEGKYFVHKCPTTIDDPCPVCESNSRYWNDVGGDGSLVPQEVRARSRKTNYVANILVVKDPANPANEGKVFLFKFGKSIFKMIQECIKPTFDDDVAINPFDLWEGANFNFKIIKKGDYPNYDKSSFLTPSELSDEQINNLGSELVDLKEFKYENEIKSYAELQKLFYEMTGEGNLNEEVEDNSTPSTIVEENDIEDTSFDLEETNDEVEDFSEKFDSYFTEED